MALKYILFDLDGTLTDSQEGITRCVQYALEHFGIKETDSSKLLRFVGPPLLQSFMEYYGFDEEKARQAISYYRERFQDIGIFENRVYENIHPVLQKLQEQGFILAIATSKPQGFTERIVEKYHLTSYFTVVAGSEMESLTSQKADVIRKVIRKLHLSETDFAQTMIMVGDRHHDVEGAKECGIPCIGVLYGYGDKTELENAGACAFAQTPEELYSVLMTM